MRPTRLERAMSLAAVGVALMFPAILADMYRQTRHTRVWR